MWRVAMRLGVRFGLLLGVLLAVGCGRQINPEWCAQPGRSDPACDVVLDARLAADMADARIDADTSVPDASCPAGGCVDPSNVLYASPAGTGDACTVDAKCDLPTAIRLAISPRNVIELEPARYEGAFVIDRSVRIVGNQATLATAGAGPTVRVTGGDRIEITGVKITGARGSGLSCEAGTLHADGLEIFGNQHGITSACALTLQRSKVYANERGALEVTGGGIDIHDNFFVGNGDDRLMGASNVEIAAGITGTFAFNTVAYNEAKQNTLPGVDCRSATVNLIGNLITDNQQVGDFNVTQVSGTCVLISSYTTPGVMADALAWANPLTLDFHLTALSTLALGQVPAANCTRNPDYDGDLRPAGAPCDFGADER